MNAPLSHPLIDKNLFGNLPKDLAFDGSSGRCLRDALMNGVIPHRLPPRAGGLLKAILSPEVEKPLIGGERQPRVFGTAKLLPFLDDLTRGAPLEMNVGMSVGSEVGPALPAYLELGVQRLKELLAVGANVRLRVFSTGSLSPQINGMDRGLVREVQARQKELLDAYVQSFYPDLFEKVQLGDIEQVIEPMSEEKIQRDLELIKERVAPEWREALEGFGAHHGGEEGARNALLYAVYHAHPQAFRDDSEAEHLLSVGGVSEKVFNEVRFGALQRPKQPGIGVVVAPSVLSKTPPYLDQAGGISIPEFVNGSSRVDAFFENPKANRHLTELPSARDLLHMGRCLADPKIEGPKKVSDGLEKLRAFYSSNL